MSDFLTYLVGGDVHGDQADPLAVAAFHAFRDRLRPDLRILNGDCWDFRPLRRKATEEEKRESMEADYEAGMEFIKRFEPTHFNRGNHDERCWDLQRNSSGIIQSYANHIIADINEVMSELHCQMLPWDKRALLTIGGLNAIHGFGGAGLSAARRHASAYKVPIIINHFHSIQVASVEALRPYSGRIIGCLCKLDMDYNRGQLGSLLHAHGFAYGWIHKSTGACVTHQAESLDGVWHLPTGFESLG